MHEDFFREIDRAWRGPRDAKIELRVLGSAALMLQTDYVRGTNDGDVSKLKRFHANDQSDVKAMIDRELVPHDQLVTRFRDAVDAFSGDARAEELPRYVRNLHRVERDMFGVAESEIEPPSRIRRRRMRVDAASARGLMPRIVILASDGDAEPEGETVQG